MEIYEGALLLGRNIRKAALDGGTPGTAEKGYTVSIRRRKENVKMSEEKWKGYTLKNGEFTEVE